MALRLESELENCQSVLHLESKATSPLKLAEGRPGGGDNVDRGQR